MHEQELFRVGEDLAVSKYTKGFNDQLWTILIQRPITEERAKDEA